jgi:hypothetical protein
VPGLRAAAARGKSRELLAVSFFLGRLDEAAEVCRAWLQEEPHPIARHMHAAYAGLPSDTVPPRLHRAPLGVCRHFDSNLVAHLDYRWTAECWARFCRCVLQGVPPTTVLDAGCGTGLCAQCWRPMRWPWEVDLSATCCVMPRSGQYSTLEADGWNGWRLVRRVWPHRCLRCPDLLRAAGVFLHCGPSGLQTAATWSSPWNSPGRMRHPYPASQRASHQRRYVEQACTPPDWKHCWCAEACAWNCNSPCRAWWWWHGVEAVHGYRLSWAARSFQRCSCEAMTRRHERLPVAPWHVLHRMATRVPPHPCRNGNAARGCMSSVQHRRKNIHFFVTLYQGTVVPAFGMA